MCIFSLMHAFKLKTFIIYYTLRLSAYMRVSAQKRKEREREYNNNKQARQNPKLTRNWSIS